MTAPKSVPFRRKREGKTDYKKRLMLLKSGRRRFVVRKSLKNIITQIVEYSPKGDKVITSASSKDLEKYGYKFSKGNLVAAYLTGFLLGKRSKKKGANDAILDLGLNISIKGSRIYAAVKGAIDAGLKVPCSPEILPSDDRIKGAHIKSYAEKIKKDGGSKNQFSAYSKNNLAAEKITEAFDDVKNKISKE